MKRLTQGEFIEHVNKLQDNQYKILSEYKGKRKPIKIQCKICGLTWETQASTLLRKRIGLNCQHHINLNDAMVRKRIKEKTNDQIEMVDKYVGAKTPTKMRCKKCGYEWDTEPYVTYKMGFGCPECSHNAKITLQSLEEYIEKNANNEYEIVSEHINGNKNKIIFKHLVCGKTFKMAPHNFKDGQRCPYEARQRATVSNSYSLGKMQSILDSTTNSRYKIVDSYVCATKNALILDKKCNSKFISNPGQLSRGETGCPICASSKGEKAVRNYLKRHGYKFEEQVKFLDCKNIRPLPFDFAVYSSDRLLCLIEYQGFQHYTLSSLFDEKPSNFNDRIARDKIKSDYCKENNIHLIKIPYKSRTSSQIKVNEVVNNYLNKYMLIPNQA